MEEALTLDGLGENIKVQMNTALRLHTKSQTATNCATVRTINSKASNKDTEAVTLDLCPNNMFTQGGEKPTQVANTMLECEKRPK